MHTSVFLCGMFELSGNVKLVMDEQTFGSGFNKREFVLNVEDGKFPQEIKFECVKDKVEILNGIKPGDRIKVAFDIRGREWKGNYYNNLVAWKITAEKKGGAGSDEPPLDHYDQTAPADLEDDEPPF